MKQSPPDLKNGISMTGFGQATLEVVDAPPKTTQTPDIAVRKSGPQPPIQPISDRFPALEEEEVIFTFFAPEAREVHVAGDFNGWRPESTPMTNTGAGNWNVRLRLRSGQYEYRFVVDGRWSENLRPSPGTSDPEGTRNLVLDVPLAVKTSIL